MKAKGLIATVVLTSLLSACGSTCNQQVLAEKFQRVQDLLFAAEKSGDIEAKGAIFYEHLAQFETLTHLSADDLGEACDILDEMLEDLE